jgi:hypothetical protein
MKTLLTIVSLLVVVLTLPALAANKKGKGAATPTPAPTTFNKIVEVNALSVTVTVGESGSEHFTYKITDGTKVTLNGNAVSARDLRAGMLVHVGVGADRATAQSVEAKDPPPGPAAGHQGRRRTN